MNARFWGLLPLALAALALGSGAAWPLALALLPLLALPFLLGPRFDVDTGRQALSSAIGAGAGYVLASLTYEAEAGRLGDGWARLAAAALMAAAARATLQTPRGGYAPAAVLGFLGLAFAGKATNAAYTALVVAFLLSLPCAFAGRGPGRPSSRRVLAGCALLALALGLGGGSTLGISRLHAWARGRTRYTTPLWQPRTGFSDRMELGSLEGLLDSDRRVLRIRGQHVDYLRGTSLDTYELGSWSRHEDAAREASVRLDASPGPDAIDIELIGARRDRLFLPLAARSLSATPSAAQRDGFGSLRAATQGASFERVRFMLGPRDVAPVKGPRRLDLQVPRRLRPQLIALVRQWTAGEREPERMLQALERHLSQDFSYSRETTRPINSDPILDFLFRDRRGHCEYFASALALLARTAGIPARVVMGYRVSEHSPFGYYVVRERNAHSWVEAWVGGTWRTRDATPEEAQPQNREHESGYAAASVDALGLAYDELTDWLAERSLLETTLAWLAGCGILALIVARGLRGRRQRTSVPDDEALQAFMRPLLGALAQRGHVRSDDEPLERLAARVPERDAADVLVRYAALRYGKLGDRTELARAAEAATRALREEQQGEP